MNVAFFLRNNLNNIPYSLGQYLSLIPYSLRPGISNSYRKSQEEIKFFSSMPVDDQKEKIYEKVKFHVERAYDSIEFYKQTYDRNNFHPRELKRFEDLEKIPIIKKDQLLEWDLEGRSDLSLKGMKANTGGSSGNPFSFYTPASKMGREWAHLHSIWEEQLNFKYSDVKLMVMGRNNVRSFVEYDFVRHSLRMDIYNSFQKISEKLNKTFNEIPIHFIHGYPSAIYELALYCKTDSLLLDRLRQHLKGCILNSEFPHIYQREVIEDTFRIKTHAFYGHSEGCIIARETNRGKYTPMQSYGYAEAIKVNGEMNLIGTNFYNHISPLIRYNTEDVIESPEFEGGLLKAFMIKEGRKGEIIFDRNGKKISLTGFIFGRHHELFNFCKHIQVSQIRPGEAKILYVANDETSFNASELFDGSNIDIGLTFEKLTSPIRTPAGKIQLLV